VETNKTNSDELKFKFFDVTADVGYWAYGESLENAFENAATAMFEVITDTSKVRSKLKKKIQLEAEDECGLLYDWLSELLFLHDSEYLVFSKLYVRIEHEKIDGQKRYFLDASAFGEEFDPSKHERRSEVKAVTYHMMEIKLEKRYILQVILDI
jgi:SHS2 domain-containing protein